MGRKFSEVSSEQQRVPYRIVAGEERRRVGRDARQEVLAAGSLGDGAAEAEAGGRGLPGRNGDRRGHHRACVFQRRAAAGDERRRQDCGPQRASHHQRADGGRAGVRPRQEEGRNHRRLRLRRRHVRHLGARSGRRRRRGEVDQRRYASRRRRSRPAGHRLDGGGVQEDRRHRSHQGSRRRAAPEGSGGEGEDRAVVGARNRDQPAVRHGRSRTVRSISR